MKVWWDHEELKAPEDRSARYKRVFPEEYNMGSSLTGIDDEYYYI